jgi:hypothetical protein
VQVVPWGKMDWAATVRDMQLRDIEYYMVEEKTIDATVISFMQNLSSLCEAFGQSWGTSSPAPVSLGRPAPCC